MKSLWLTSFLVVALSGTAQALPIAYEGVQYPAPGPLLGPAFGFGPAPWISDAGVVVQSPTLFSPLDLPPSGNKVTGFFNFIDPLQVTQAPFPGKEFWASVLIAHVGPNDQTFMGLGPAGAALGDLPAVAIGVRLGQYGIFEGGAFTGSPKPFTPAGSTDLLVAHFVAGGATWIVSLYVNPTSFAVPDLVKNVAPVPYGTMINQNQAEFESDEFRLGDEAGDVSAVGVVPTGPATWGKLKATYR